MAAGTIASMVAMRLDDSPRVAKTSATPVTRYESDAGSPMRMGALAAPCPHGRLKSNVSMPRSTPMMCSRSVKPAMEITNTDSTRATTSWDDRGAPACNSNAAPASTALSAALANIEMCWSVQSVSIGRLNAQPASAEPPAMSEKAPAASATCVGPLRKSVGPLDGIRYFDLKTGRQKCSSEIWPENRQASSSCRSDRLELTPFRPM